MVGHDLEIYTDGSYLESIKQGAFAVRFIGTDFDGEMYIESHQSSAYQNTNSFQMEIKGIIWALQHVAERNKAGERFSRIVLKTDSAQVVNNLSKAKFEWHKSKWYYKSGKPIENADLWKQLISALQAIPMIVDIRWIKSHDKNEHNHAVDELARQAASLPVFAKTSGVYIHAREKLSSRPMERESVRLSGQILVIRIISSEWLKTQKSWKHKYEVMSKRSAYHKYVDVAFSKESMRTGCSYRVRMNSSTKYPQIVKVYEELTDST